MTAAPIWFLSRMKSLVDKPMAKKLFAAAGIPVARHEIKTQQDIMCGNVMPAPYVIKPVNEGSSVGVYIIREGLNEPFFEESGWPFGDTVMVEEYIPGREMTVSVMGDRALGVTEITTSRGFYDYDAKYLADDTRYQIPCGLDPDSELKLQHLALDAFRVLGCRTWGRVDIMQDRQGEFWILEVNTVPGMTDHSLVPMSARAAGISFEELVVRILMDTLEAGDA